MIRKTPLIYKFSRTKDSAGETNFLTGDKVYVSGMNTFEIALPTSSDTSFGSKIVVSGLVVGRDMSGADTDGGLYTISDAGDADGGLVAYANTAVGKFVNSREADELVPTGKLQKYGNSTLIFTNTGGNLFSEGVELYGGTVAITRGDQLVVGPGRAITFKADATLQNNADLILDRDTAIVLEAGSATFRADNAFEMQGVISGTGSMIKAGTGTLTLSGENTYSGGMTVSGGILQIGNGGTAGSIVGDVNNNATLAFNRADDISYGKVISGTGSMIKDGPGALTLSGENTYTGGTAISAGTLQLGNGGTSGSITGNVSNNGRLVFRRSDVSSFDGIISGAGTVEQAGAGTTLLTAGNTHSGPTIVSAGTLQAGAVHTFSPASAMRVEPGALLDLNGFDQTVAGMVNAGMVRLKGAPGTVLTVRGDYTGINGTLAFNTVLGGDNSPSDKLVIDGGLGDDTSVLVTNIGGAGAKTTGNGILLVEAINGATTTNTAFSLGAPVLAGPYEYRLYRSGLDGGSPDNWFLRSSLDSVDDTPAFRQEASLYAAIPSLALSYGNLLLDSLDKRMGGQRVMDAEAQEDGARHLAWGRVIGLNGSRDGEGLGIHGDRGPDYDYHITALQAGTDLYRVKRADGSADNTGFYVAYGETKADVSHFGGGDAGDDRLYGLTLGAYWTHSGAAGWYLDGVLQGTWYDVEASGRLPEMDTRGFGLGLSLEGGYPIRFDNGLVLEPQAQLTYQSINLDDGHDMGAAIRFHDVESLNGRLGLRLSRSWDLKAMGEDKPRQALAWGRVSVLNEFLGRPETDFSSEEGFLPFRSDMHETSFRVDAGIDAEIARDVFLYASLQYQQKFGGDDHAIGGQVGLKVKL